MESNPGIIPRQTSKDDDMEVSQGDLYFGEIGGTDSSYILGN